MVLETIDGDAPDFRAALEAVRLPTDDLQDDGPDFFRAREDGRIIGFGGFELYGEHVLLRSIVILPGLQNRGLGRALTGALLHQAREAGARQAYLLTNSAEAFFESLGFVRIARTTAPASILNTRQASSICGSAAMLSRNLED